MKFLAYLLTASVCFGQAFTFQDANWHIQINYAPGPWSKRQEVTVDNTGNAASFTDYPVKVDVVYDSDMQADFDDIRFRASDGTTELDFWLESKTNSNSATYWVKVPSIAGSSTETIYMYYFNAEATSASSGADVFTYYDHFVNTNTHRFAFGSDSGWQAGFDPVSRRFYRFGATSDAIEAYFVDQWLNIDDWSAGYIYPHISHANGGVVYHPVDQLFYIYGGCTDGFATVTDKIWSFDPATLTFTELAQTLPSACILAMPVYDPGSGKIFIFGGRTAMNTRVDTILVHDTTAETITDTTAVLPVAMDGMAPTYASEDGKIYLFGGAWYSSGQQSRVDILEYDPSTPGTNPTDTTEDLAVAGDTFGSVYHDGNIYLFGGYNFSTATYSDLVQKFDVGTQTISTLAETLYKADDDMSAFYDSVTGKIYVGPVLHSTGTANEDERKVCVLEFDPSTDTFAAEPALGTTPTGWASTGTATVETPRAIGGTYMVLSDLFDTSYVAAKETFTALSGEMMLEVKAFAPHSINNLQIYGGPSAINFLVNSAFVYRNRDTNIWGLGLTSTVNTNIAALAQGPQILGTLIDVANEDVYGLVNRSNKTPAINYYNAGAAIEALLISTPTTGITTWLVDWALIRKSTTGTEPTTSLGAEEG